MKQTNNKITILVSSCDKYEDAWEPFFRLFNKYWQDCPYSFVLSTETKQFSCDYLNVKTINCDKSFSWGKRLKNAVNEIESEYILFFLDDFFVRDNVEVTVFNRACELLDTKQEIGAVKFYSYPNCSDGLIKGDVYGFEEFSYLDDNIRNSRDVEATLWRKDCFLKMILDNDDAWAFEVDGNYRMKFVGYDFVCQNTKNDVAFNYCIKPKYNLGISCGKWLWDTPALFEENGIYGIDYEKLGVLPRFKNRDEYEGYARELRRTQSENSQVKVELNVREKLYNVKKRILNAVKKTKSDNIKAEQDKIDFYKNYYETLQQ